MSGKKKTAITDKHCLQNVLILAVWDDVNPVFDHSPKAIFQIYLHYKTVWWKTHWLCSDYRLLQPNEQTFVLSTSPAWTTSSWLWRYLNFAACYLSCQKVTFTCITHQTWGKQPCRASCCPADRRTPLCSAPPHVCPGILVLPPQATKLMGTQPIHDYIGAENME